MTAQRAHAHYTLPATTTAPARDALTGEPLPTGSESRLTLAIYLRDERVDNPRGVRLGHAPDTTACPTRLHTATVETTGGASDLQRGGLGGHTFARQFAQYLSRVQPASVQRAEMERRYWWASAYGRLRVKARFLRRDGAIRGEVNYRAALGLSSGYSDYAAAAAETGHTPNWLRWQVERAERFAHEPAVRVVRPIEPRRID